jgi:hypothetical protein
MKLLKKQSSLSISKESKSSSFSESVESNRSKKQLPSTNITTKKVTPTPNRVRFSINDPTNLLKFQSNLLKQEMLIDKNKLYAVDNRSFNTNTNYASKLVNNALKSKQVREKNSSMVNDLVAKLELIQENAFMEHLNSPKPSASEQNDEDVDTLHEISTKSRISTNFYDGNNPSPEKELLKKDFVDRVFWTKEKMEQIRGQLRTAKAKIGAKMKREFDELDHFIENKDRDSIL